MEKKRKQENSHWTIPGIFFGEVEVMDAVQRIATQPQQAEWSGKVSLPVQETENVQELKTQISSLKNTIDQVEERLKMMQVEHKRERERLYQMVLLLKQEWERARDEHRHR